VQVGKQHISVLSGIKVKSEAISGFQKALVLCFMFVYTRVFPFPVFLIGIDSVFVLISLSSWDSTIEILVYVGNIYAQTAHSHP
jgi:hypothetical protein